MHSRFPPLKYLNIPNLLTSLSVCVGFLTLVLLYKGTVAWALAIYPLTFLCDTLDGPVARKLGQSSHFGEELDTLADVFSFIVVPVWMALLLGFQGWDYVPFLLLYTLAGFWRLAHYNTVGTQKDSHGKVCFLGVPACSCAAPLYMLLSLSRWFAVGFLVHFSFTLCAILMVSSIKYPKYKNPISYLLSALLFVFAFVNLGWPD